jgi:acyl-CoA thioester hydrolase
LKDFALTISPRFYETDALGHINNASIAAWFEIVRMKFIDSLGGRESWQAAHWILASLQIDFVAETFFGTDVIARVTGAEVGNSSLKVLCEMHQEGKLTVKGRAVLVYLDLESKQPARVPDGLRRQLGDT